MLTPKPTIRDGSGPGEVSHDAVGPAAGALSPTSPSEPPNRIDGWHRPAVSVIVLAIVLIGLIILVPSALLMIFAGILLAILLRYLGTLIASPLALGTGWGVAVAMLSLILLSVWLGASIAPAATAQAEELYRQVPKGIEALRSTINEYAWGKEVLRHMDAPDFWSFDPGGAATRAVSSAFGYLGNIALLAFIALYGALNPGTYKRGFIQLIAPSIRPKAECVLSQSVQCLQNWLKAQLLSMAIVGLLTGAGLWIIGMPLALVLGLIAGILAFIPTVGPILALIPAALLALPEGTNQFAAVVCVYAAVQALESNVLTPLIQQRTAALPPVLVISSQLAFASLFGLIGLALAAPLTAVFIQVVKSLYVESYLERED